MSGLQFFILNRRLTLQLILRKVTSEQPDLGCRTLQRGKTNVPIERTCTYPSVRTDKPHTKEVCRHKFISKRLRASLFLFIAPIDSRRGHHL